MYNQGYRPPNQASSTQQQPNMWYYPTGYNGGTPTSPQQATQGAQASAKAKRARAPRSGGGKGAPSGGGKPSAPKKRSLKWQLIKVLIILVLIGGAVAGIYVWKTQSDIRPYTTIFLDNVSVDGINLQGMTW